MMLLLALMMASGAAANGPLAWPPQTAETRPWSYWWWLGSAVDPANLTRELERYRDAGMGGVHIIPIYGAKGYESRYVEYLSPEWMRLLRHTVTEARRLGLDVDMTTGTGWCFGGPQIGLREASARFTVKTYDVPEGQSLTERFEKTALHALVAYGRDGRAADLLPAIRGDGSVLLPGAGPWRVFALSQQSATRVKRAAPGGAGYMMNPLFADAMRVYLGRFSGAFDAYDGPRPRAMYHDSFEYGANWSPGLLAEFQKRRGYRLEDHLPAMFEETSGDAAARVKADYRETISDVLVESVMPQWIAWCRARGIRTRYQAHGSPANLLDLYALSDIPETEMFNQDRSSLVSRLASSAAHVAGRRLVAAETGTWLKEHFTETLADLKELADQLFLSGVNHIVYHGTAYSPDEAPWPGWLFYASTEMNPRNSVWRDVPALNAYISRVQSVLQSGAPDNDLLLYWPIHDVWHDPSGAAINMTVHQRAWLEAQPVSALANALERDGYSFDFISDRQLAGVTGSNYAAVVVPRCVHMPPSTLERLLGLARAGATVIFENGLPADVPGLSELDSRRKKLESLSVMVRFAGSPETGVKQAAFGKGRVLAGDARGALRLARVRRESLAAIPGLEYIRRRDGGDRRHYFVANRGREAVSAWVPLGTPAESVGILDPMTGQAGAGALRRTVGGPEVYLALEPGQAIVLRTFERKTAAAPAWTWWTARSGAVPLEGSWRVTFLQGGPELPPPFTTSRLASWTELGGEKALAFAGTAWYTITFDAPASSAPAWWIDLGEIRDSARVLLNGRSKGTFITAPARVLAGTLQPKGNVLEVEVTNRSANRIRDLDRRKVPWKVFHDINFANLDYKPFDASGWPVFDSGLLGPVTLREAIPVPAP